MVQRKGFKVARAAEVTRKTKETEVSVSLVIDGDGTYSINTGIGFFNHMLELFSKHGMFKLDIQAKGDLHVGAHHVVEDVGICLGQAFRKALGDKSGIRRYGSAILPMDEALAMLSLDFSGRPFLAYNVDLSSEHVGGFDTDLTHEFLGAFVNKAEMNLHVRLLAGKNGHHIIEAIFKALGRAIDEAATFDERRSGIPSTKGTL